MTGIDFDADRLEEKIGIRFRHIARLRKTGETTADFAERAIRRAADAAGIGLAEIDLLIVATDTPNTSHPPHLLWSRGGCKEGAAHRIVRPRRLLRRICDRLRYGGQGACHRSGQAVCGRGRCLQYARLHEDTDSFGLSIFADGAGCMILERTETRGGNACVDGSRYIGSRFITDGTQWDFIGVYAGGTRTPVTKELLESGSYGLELRKPLPGNRNVTLWPPLVRGLVKSKGRRVEELDHIVFTQINKSVIGEVMRELDLPLEKTTMVMDGTDTPVRPAFPWPSITPSPRGVSRGATWCVRRLRGGTRGRQQSFHLLITVR
jgi:3-oxoacyl-[acyl-carrier-protein] synthase-3